VILVEACIAFFFKEPIFVLRLSSSEFSWSDFFSFFSSVSAGVENSLSIASARE
jgi:hypothetical protein